ncbi:hypothetical protein DM01DRAFT_1110802 [Hesseltinella vesiculosa]|uniref:Uncharacterized protein n=1 Tax=Hesseltinella vesiculosa TaxID=101127 RepID=A0A1X2GAG9_9FUNG|nr:hypothetical protein DM01DRAFT_1110802 [Hesseltinella vesiculosa]
MVWILCPKSWFFFPTIQFPACMIFLSRLFFCLWFSSIPPFSFHACSFVYSPFAHFFLLTLLYVSSFLYELQHPSNISAVGSYAANWEPDGIHHHDAASVRGTAPTSIVSL